MEINVSHTYRGYHQIAIDDSCRKKIAFIIYRVLSHYKRIPSRFSSTPYSFQHLLTHILMKTIGNFLLLYIDDILVFFKTIAEYLEHSEYVFNCNTIR